MKRKGFPILHLVFVLTLSACNMPLLEEAQATAAPPSAPPEPTATVEVIETEIVPTEIVHTLVPPETLPPERESHAGDHDSSETASRKHPPGGDRFSRGTFERPFNANTMDVYFPYLDIIDSEIFEDDTWIFATITMRGLDENESLPGQYFVEIDQNRDGGGDWLVGVISPTSSGWSSENVRIWQDSNDDVGGIAPYLADDNPPYSDGYELLIYDQGEGNNPDAAFARIDSENPHIIQVAIQKSLLDENLRLLIGMWAGTNLDPALFDLNDHFTHEQAGAADPGLEIYYPIKAISEMDNSCRMAIGFEPTGAEPGLCQTALPPGAPGGPPPGGCPAPSYCQNWDSTYCQCMDLY